MVLHSGIAWIEYSETSAEVSTGNTALRIVCSPSQRGQLRTVRGTQMQSQVKKCHLLVVAHPVGGEHDVHGGIAGLPGLHLVGHVQGLAGGVQVQIGLDVGEVVAEGGVTTGHADVVGVQTRVVVRGGLHQVAVVVRGHTGVGVHLASLGHLHAGGTCSTILLYVSMS